MEILALAAFTGFEFMFTKSKSPRSYQEYIQRSLA